jgi:hypothetical protein
MRTDTVDVRLLNVDELGGAPLDLQRLAFRSWRNPVARGDSGN